MFESMEPKGGTRQVYISPPPSDVLYLIRKTGGVKAEPPQAAEFLQKRLISEFFGFQWQNLAEILSLFKKYNNLRKVAVREKV